MRRLLLASVFAAVPLLALGPTPSLAVSPSEEQCVAEGGTFDRTQGTVTCTSPPDKVGEGPKDETKTTSGQKTTTEEGGQGNLNNKETIVCTGPKGQQDPACP
jgi:hypothetical protein